MSAYLQSGRSDTRKSAESNVRFPPKADISQTMKNPATMGRVSGMEEN